MGDVVANVDLKTHAQPPGAITADRGLRFHWGNKSIDESLDGDDLGSTWKDLVDAVRTQDADDFDDAIDALKLLVSFTWEQDWTDAVKRLFEDVIRPPS